ncbi:MAG TPA: prolyl oligopeptidase family serine peptidase [Gemmatimonadaceae bacterium]|jgi:dipeptidyl aminopeptidase/acylaminoacyl peptidase|nr:prolyl oligopeptidase family serine peptidase [Gemmatimonadaceae bacterium]
MRVGILRSLLVLSLGPVAVLAAQQPAPASGSAKQMQPADLKAWKTIRSPVLSPDGKWFAYVLAPNEGDANVIIRSTGTDNKEYTFPIGSSDGGRGGGGGRGGAAPDAGGGPLAISADSRWVAFMVYPAAAGGRGGRGGAGRGGRGGGAQTTDGAAQTPAPQNKLALVNLATGEKKEFDRVRRYAFNGDKPTWLAIQAPAEAPSAPAGNAAGGAARGGGAGGNAAAGRAEGTDLLLYNLSNGEAVNVGNVAEFGFDDSGDWLAYTIDARDAIGNGVQLRNMKSDVVRPIDSDRALYRHLVWSDSLDALAVLRGRIDSTARDTVYSVVAFSNIAAQTPTKTVFDASQHAEFPKDMAVSVDRAPRLAEDLSAVFFGVHAAKKPAALLAGRGGSVIQAGAPGMGGTINQPRVNEATEENPSLILWNVKDPRLQSQQIVQEAQDRAFTFLSEYRLADNRFVQLADEALRNVNVAPHDHFAIGTDTREYENNASYTGRTYEDDFTVDLRTGKRDLVLKKHRPSIRIASPNGKEELYWGDDGNYWVLDLATGAKRNVTKGTGVNFSNTDDDHNYLVPPPRAPFGWTRDGASVLLSDGWDVWKVPTNGTGSAVNLTVNGKRDQIRYNRVYAFERGVTTGGGRGGRGGRGGGGASLGLDLSQPLYVGAYGEWTKKAGLSRVDPGTPGAKSLVWDDATFDFQKAREGDVFLYTKQTSRDFPNYFVANADFKGGRQLTDADPQQKDFAWTSGVKLINYTSAKGDKLQGALYLPANYEPGKKYPLLVTIYEKRSNLANTYVTPSETSTPNRSIYTSRGYAVLDPDIVYRVNDPGMSAVWCVIPAVKAAIATGMIDSSNVGLWGHSWGGYQTAFLVTQTNIFKAAIAGAPLTNMVSMYASVYWNTGNSDASIFEDSQGRFKGNVAENTEAYIRNSPVFHAEKVKTPLIILADDKDGAVDFNQGITYYNTLAQLKKDVILLEYVGENHGLARPINQKDYAMRQKDWFDHYLKGVPAPDWMTKGIPRIKMDEYWQSLKAQQAGPIVP